MPIAYLAVGSNLGDRQSHLDHALSRCASLGVVIEGSPIYETEPVGGPSGQEPYLNAVLGIRTDLEPRTLLDRMLDIERERGRTRDERWGPRTLDLDLLWYDGTTIHEVGLVVPHPGIRDRPFVLAPVADLAAPIGDADGVFADAYAPEGAAGLRRVSGPVHPDGTRWMVGLAEALTLENVTPRHVKGYSHPDWSNTTDDAFGAFLIGLALEACRDLLPGAVPSHLTYRFLRAVPASTIVDIEVIVDRQSNRSTDATVTLAVAGAVAGRCSIALISHPLDIELAPEAPLVMERSAATPTPQLVETSGRRVGPSARSWSSRQRWDLPDLADGHAPVVRAWSPNVVFGSPDAFHHAVAIAMPIDAVIWPATLRVMGLLPHDTALSTPTIELSIRFGSIVEDAWFIAEGAVDHLTDRSVSGTVRVWGAGGRYAGVGHSINLLRR